MTFSATEETLGLVLLFVGFATVFGILVMCAVGVRRAVEHRDTPGAGLAASKRLGRLVFGGVVLTGTALLVHRVMQPVAVPAHAWAVVLGTWAAAFASYAVARRLPGLPDRYATASLVVPAAAIALLLPITIQLPFAFIMVPEPSGYDAWSRYCLAAMGPPQAVFAVLIAIRAGQLAHGRRALSPLLIYAATVLVTCGPSLNWIAIPPIAVAFTYLPLLALVHRMRRIIDAERTAPRVPYAVARCAEAVS